MPEQQSPVVVVTGASAGGTAIATVPYVLPEARAAWQQVTGNRGE